MSKEVISIKNLWAGYEGRPVLENVTLSVLEKDFLGIIGPNGGGKTTLLKVILGVIRPFKGEVKVFGDNPEKARKKIGYVPQYSLIDRDFPASILDVVLMGRFVKSQFTKSYSKEDILSAEKALEVVEMLEFKDKPIGKISEGQRQRVFIARALVSNPELLILDEPTASIDEKMEVSLYELLFKLKKEITIILVSHDIGIISQYVDKVACLNGKLFYHGSKDVPASEIVSTYGCPIDLIGHGEFPHRVFREHKNA